MNHHVLLIVHLICATVWVGGHLYLCCCILPGVLKTKKAQKLLAFEKSFEPLGLSSLALLVITGLWMMRQFGIQWSDCFSFSTPIEQVTSTKLILLLTTVMFAISAQTRVIPKLKRSPKKLPEMAVHAICVTLLGMALLIAGSFVRYGGF